MKVGIVCYPTIGGSGVVATALGHALAARGDEVHFIAYEVPFRLNMNERNIVFHQVDITRYDLFKYPDYALPLAVKIASVSEQYALDVLHVHYAIPHATSAYLAKQILGSSKPAVITTLHGTDITLVGRDPSYFRIVKYSIENSDGVTAVSESLRRQTVEYFQVDHAIEVIYNFFVPRPELVGKKPLRERFVNLGEKLLVHASNFRSVKRVEDVVYIFLRIKKQIKAKLLFLGSGAGIEGVRQLVEDYDLRDDVFFQGQDREIDAYVASADLFILPSAQESFGLAALEAMAYGIPVIATNIGGLPELVEHGKTGYLAPLGDVDQMAKDAIKLLTNRTLYEQMSQNARIRAQETFCVSKILPQYISLYEKIMKA
ncbi:MAG: N-acetyl-alpha-D-glucosaminyl L-malate synthase BshA [Waddliaceae bacterium]